MSNFQIEWDTINKEVTRKRTEFGLETLEIGQTLASKRLGQAAELIDGLDDAQKTSLENVTAAINDQSIEELRSAASGLNTSDETMAKLSSYLTDAANALESYLDE